jgi:hypothetical protein
MANLDFYALEDDQRSLLEFIYAETDVAVFELASEFDCDVRRFDSISAIEAAFSLGRHPASHFQLWSPSVMKAPVIRRIDLKVPGHSFRYAVEGAGLMQLHLDGRNDEVIYHTHYGHWNEAGARERSIHPADVCDWKTLAKLSGRIQRHVRNRLSVAKLFGRPILPQAYRAVQQGAGLLFSGVTHHADSKAIVRNRAAPL